ncbi:MAG: hypothetical protein AAF363_18970 [Bacteroidota bacterium]
MKNFDEKLDAYLRGDLDENSKSNFLNEVNQNPELQSKISFEKQLVEGIKEARVLEIKKNLSSIPVSYQPGFWESVGSAKVAISSGIVVGLLGISAYIFLPDDDTVLKESDLVDVTEIQELNDISNSVTDSDNIIVENNTSQNTDSKGVTEDIDDEIVPKVEFAPINDIKISVEAESNNEVETFDPSILEPEDNFISPSSSDLKNVEKDESHKTLYESTTIERIDDGEHDFHYQFYNKKLFLYGSFSKSPYEIIELNSEEGRQYFLYYDHDFYPLDRDRDEIGELKALRDSSLESRLRKLKD